jgi:hypothetical protein
MGFQTGTCLGVFLYKRIKGSCGLGNRRRSNIFMYVIIIIILIYKMVLVHFKSCIMVLDYMFSQFY